jgi:hypothetical protein
LANNIRPEALTTVKSMFSLYGRAGRFQRFAETYCLHLQGLYKTLV